MSTTAISSLTASTSSTTSTTSATTSNSDLSFEDWINLLATELQYQDPTDPISSSEYVSQMASLSSLSQIENIYSAVSNVEAYNLIGKSVTYQTTDSSGNTVEATGTVSSVILSGSSTYLSIDGNAVSLDAVVSVADAATTDTASA
ncbi:flagellar hook capping FlgD N-terminal domain-containing protein [Anaeroselena agilis]|uniref:Flagellar hook capping FlgD N-terminal domain-containing protein n=1 Tax=Anaeroselena agilis TaxID=3063788 RepID=A0ABU3NZ93_9FIRM|nr:flagellar hook capping FlgD N-terminal domain-containing protein [Selenomonadales bacterium 4137-cl]